MGRGGAPRRGPRCRLARRPPRSRRPIAGRVTAPTLLIVGGATTPVLELNQEALELLPVDAELAIVPGATHLFEEPGALEEVARLARDWFVCYLAEAGDDR